MGYIIEKHPGELLLCDLDCSLLLSTSEVITNVVSMEFQPAGATALTFGTPSVNDAPVNYPDGRVVGLGKVVQVLIGGGAIPTGQRSQEYIVIASVQTNNPSELMKPRGRLLLTEDP